MVHNNPRSIRERIPVILFYMKFKEEKSFIEVHNLKVFLQILHTANISGESFLPNWFPQ